MQQSFRIMRAANPCLIAVLVAALIVVLQSSTVAMAGELGSYPSEDGEYQALLSLPEAEGWQLNQTTSLVIKLVSRSSVIAATSAPLVGPPAPLLRAAALSFNATMPAHGHGMVLKPEMTQNAPDQFRLDGVKLHMPGAWQLTFDVVVDDRSTRFSIPVQL